MHVISPLHYIQALSYVFLTLPIGYCHSLKIHAYVLSNQVRKDKNPIQNQLENLDPQTDNEYIREKNIEVGGKLLYA